MKVFQTIYRKIGTRSILLALIVLSFAIGVTIVSNTVEANHPVLLEGNNANGLAPVAGTGPAGIGGTATTAPIGNGGDYDGDGMVGTAEDVDNATDRIFGTMTAALLAANGGANANGHVIIVTSGRFPETITIPNTAAGQTNLNGTTIIEAAPGVQANLDAVLQGDPSVAPATTNGTRQGGNGMTINFVSNPAIPAVPSVILRNLVIRNYQIGLNIMGNARVTVTNCRFDSNVQSGIAVSGTSKLVITDSVIVGNGVRVAAAPVGTATPNPGNGIAFSGSASGQISQCTITGNVAAGVTNSGTAVVGLNQNNVFDNSPNFQGRLAVNNNQ
ncbi:MAG: right-handed parallel beta-helix repeat-containing protein [Acidobacteriota bacterium]